MSRAQVVAVLFIGFVIIVGGAFLLIGLLKGDQTNEIDPTPPEVSPSSS